MENRTPTNTLSVPAAPRIPGLSFRGFNGKSDYPSMVAVITRCKETDEIERADSIESMTHYYAHLVNCDPYQDLLIAQVDDQVIGYTRVTWWEQTDGLDIYRGVCFVLPEWRQQGIGTSFLLWDEQRLREIAAGHPNGRPRYFESAVEDNEPGAGLLLKHHGYEAVRYDYVMVRPDLEDIPQAPMPAGLEVRPVKLEHVPAIREASVEAFRDHWGFNEASEPTAEQMVEDPSFDPSLWQVAWEGDQVAGMVLGFINKQENEVYKRKRGWTENVCVRRPWRKRGLARALLVKTMLALKERGMQEVALGVDTQNTSGALRLYESLGYRPVRRSTFYRKPMK